MELQDRKKPHMLLILICAIASSVYGSSNESLSYDSRKVSDQGEKAIEQWRKENAEFIRRYGPPGDSRVQVAVWYLHFERGLIIYDVSNAWTYILFYETGLYSQVINPKVLITQHHSSSINEALFESFMRSESSALTREKYKKLLQDRGNKYIIGGIGTIYVREDLLDELGDPLSTEDYFDDVIQAYGNEKYILIANLLMQYQDEQTTLAVVLFPEQRRFRVDTVKLLAESKN